MKCKETDITTRCNAWGTFNHFHQLQLRNGRSLLKPRRASHMIDDHQRNTLRGLSQHWVYGHHQCNNTFVISTLGHPMHMSWQGSWQTYAYIIHQSWIIQFINKCTTNDSCIFTIQQCELFSCSSTWMIITPCIQQLFSRFHAKRLPTAFIYTYVDVQKPTMYFTDKMPQTKQIDQTQLLTHINSPKHHVYMTIDQSIQTFTDHTISNGKPMKKSTDYQSNP